MIPNDSSTDSRSSGGPRSRYWRSLSELQQQDDFQQYLHREFPVAASEFPEGVSRRRWMQLMGASFAMAGVAGCRYPEELIAPFVVRPEGRVPGEHYSRSTNFELAGRVYNLLVTNVDGRPIKIEPNVDHPASAGTDAYVQASILGLYDPDRARSDEGPILRREPGERPEVVGWDAFENYGPALVRTARANNLAGRFAVLAPPTASPSVVRMLERLRERLPDSIVAVHDGVHGDAMRQATREVFGNSADQVLDLASAEVILSLQADFLGSDPGFIRNAQSFAANRDPLANEQGSMSRLYVVEGGYTPTGASADSRLALRPSQMPAFLSELGRRVESYAGEASEQDATDEESGELPENGLPENGLPENGLPEKAYDELDPSERLERFLDAAARDIAKAGEKAVVVVGEHLGPEAVAAGIRMNRKLGSLGTLQRFRSRVEEPLGETSGLAELVEKIDADEVDSLLILGGNPAFTAPADVDFATSLRKVDNTIYLGEYDDETATLCRWSLPLAHPLESWADCVNDQGHYGVCQPQILPLLGGRSVAEVLALMAGEDETDGESIVRRTADGIGEESLSDRRWRQLLHDGFDRDLLAGQWLQDPSGEYAPLTDDAPVASGEVDMDEVEVVFVPADGIYDGRFANNGWLQELPQSLTKLTWGNAAIMSPATARALREIYHGVMVALTVDGRTTELPVYEMPGCAPGVVTVPFGYGRRRAGMVGGMEEEDVEPVGIDVSRLRTADASLVAYGVEARPRYTEYELATTQDHWAIDELGREEAEDRSFTLIREGTKRLLEKIPEFAEAKGPHVPPVGDEGAGSPFEEPVEWIRENEPDVPQWGMAIDLNKCIGCNACVIACQSENNVPIVGKEQVANSREMHWLRIDRYFQGDEENAEIVQQPVACMHCETAPCEQVCPVAATVHTNEGLNAMAYNRCIGTRYCANNCPFKVRRFNYFNYNEDIGVGYGVKAFPGTIETANRKLQQLVLNPEVTVRGRGVMEKCTYCVQRIEEAKIAARRDGGRPIADGEVVTACQSACPTSAIDFGNIMDPDAEVAKKHADVRSYGMLSQLNVKPRTEYLARVRNPHPTLMTRAQLTDLQELKPPHHGHHGDDGHGHDSHGHDSHGHDSHGHGDDSDGHGDEAHGEGSNGHGGDATGGSGNETAARSTRLNLPVVG